MFYLYLAICASLLSSKWAWRVNIICLPWLKISILVLGEEEELKWLSWFVFSFLGSPKQSSNIGRRGMESRYDMSQMGFLSCFFSFFPLFYLVYSRKFHDMFFLYYTQYCMELCIYRVGRTLQHWLWAWEKTRWKQSKNQVKAKTVVDDGKNQAEKRETK